MAAPVNPTWPGGSVAFWQLMVDMITIASNLSIPNSADAALTTVFSGTTAALLVAAAEKQRDLY